MYGAQDLSAHDAGRLHRRDLRRDAGQARLHLRRRRPQRAPRVPRRGRRVVNAKVKAAFRHGVTPILCVGEGLEVRQAGKHVEHMLRPARRPASTGVPAEQATSVVVAYEPVWAIGTGEVATPEDAQEVCAAIRTRLAELYSGDLADGVRVLYGGSVKAGNVAAIMAQQDVDGALVGGASIDADEFAAICRFRDHLQTS